MFDRYIAFHARSRPSAPAILTPDDGSLTFAQLDAEVDRAAALLGDVQADRGEAVAVEVSDPYRHWLAVLALARLGIASASGSDRNCRLRISDDAQQGFVLSGPGSELQRAELPADPNALGRILKTSGTTGEEKRIALSWRVIDAGIRNAFVAYGAPEGAWLPTTGIHTILGLVVTLACWASGNPVILGLGGSPSYQALARLRPRLIALVPDQLSRLVDQVPDGAEGWPLRVITGGGAVPPPLARRTRASLTVDLRSVYGASETGAVAVAEIAVLEQRELAAGHVLPGVEVEIVDEEDRPLPAGETGRVRIRSDRVAEGYLDHAPGRTSTFRHGWFYPGDLGRIEADGLLAIEGRADDLMNLAGHKVLPHWIEQAALTCASVEDAGAFAMPDEGGLDRCWLAVVGNGGAHDPDELAGVLKRQLGWLRSIEWMAVTAIPRNAMGKIDRNRLREAARALQAERETQVQ